LNDLAKYNQEVLFPALDDKFAKIDGKFAKIDGKFAKINGKFAKIDDHFARIHEEIKEKFDKVINGQDKILEKLENLSDENVASVDLYKKQEEKIENHEIRIKFMEQKMAIEAK